MTQELKATVVVLKSLEQDIRDPIIVGGGDSNGRCLKVVFMQEAAAQLTSETKVYLSWRHIQKNIRGYNIFTELKNEDNEDFPPTWYIYYPKTLLHEGDVLARIELVDDISVAASTDFNIHILADPWDGSEWIVENDLSEFKKALNRASQINVKYDELEETVRQLSEMFDIIPFEDDDENGDNDNDGFHPYEIIEWTGGDDGEG